MITVTKVPGIKPVVVEPPDTFDIKGLSLLDIGWLEHQACFKITTEDCGGPVGCGLSGSFGADKAEKVAAFRDVLLRISRAVTVKR